MTIYLILSIIIILITLTFLSLKYTRKFRKKNQDSLSFLLTIIATFLGVFLAIYYNNKAIEIKDKTATIKILEAAYQELDLIQIETELIIEHLTKSQKNLGQYILEHKPPFPTIFSRTMQNDLVLKNISGASMRAMNNGWRNLYAYHNRLSDPQNVMSISEDNFFKLLNHYNGNLNFNKQLIFNECLFLKNELSLEKIDEKIEYEYNLIE